MKATPQTLRTGGFAAAALLLALLTAGCSSVVDTVPQALGGLPEAAKNRSAAPSAYPSVHDMPPPRQDSALSDAESKRLREDLKTTRTRIAPAPAPEATGSARNP